ncbi:MAG: hypothetical protein ABI831_23755 [Betaproteobacteria bacterium]
MYKKISRCAAFVAAVVLSFVGFAAPAGAQTLSLDLDLGAQWRVNSTARLISGMPPMFPAHVEFAESSVWKEHSQYMRAAWARMNERQVAAMSAWREGAIPKTCPLGKTVLYPFSGPDFFNAYWLFPDCETFVMWGLEHAGEVPDIEAMSERQLERLVADVRIATTDFFKRNYFITENMSKQLRTAQLRGVVPLFMISMALSGVDILRVQPYELPPVERTGPMPSGKPMRQLKGVTIEFRVPGSARIRRVHYFTVDVTDRGLAFYPEFLTFVRSLGPTTTFIKSASYLLHGREFRQIRSALLDVSGFLVQDDSGVPYAMLKARGWTMQLYGKYDVPIPPFQGAFQVALDKAYKSQLSSPLPFTFGYQYHDSRDERSNVLVGQRPLQTAQAEAETQPAPHPRRKGIALRSSTRQVH